ncbi:MAG: hypothetical protein K2J32_11020 [Ruminococcus sp.]|nr:hypothetical protein [Ruminococcus sp.]
MKKTIKRVTASLTAMLMMFGSTYTAVGSVSATNNEIQSRKSYMYGDVHGNGSVDLNDAVLIAQFITVYKKGNNGSIISVEDAIEYKGEYCLPVPQAADVDGDGYITDADAICVQSYVIGDSKNAGRCGESFDIDE